MNFQPAKFAKENNIIRLRESKCEKCKNKRIIYVYKNWQNNFFYSGDFPVITEKLCSECHPDFPESLTLICKIQNCESKVQSLGFCKKHYIRYWMYGDPFEIKKAENGTILKFLNESLDANTEECINWPYGKSATGYGAVTIDGVQMNAHRYICIKKHGEPENKELHAAHYCGNRSCINHKHLRWASPKENAADRWIHGTQKAGEKHCNSKLTEEEVIEIFKSKIPSKKLAKIYNVAIPTIDQIKRGHSWKWLTSNL